MLLLLGLLLDEGGGVHVDVGGGGGLDVVVC